MMGVRKIQQQFENVYIYRISHHTVISYHGPHIPPIHSPHRDPFTVPRHRANTIEIMVNIFAASVH
jgi:hypothetical protein